MQILQTFITWLQNTLISLDMCLNNLMIGFDFKTAKQQQQKM